MKKFIQEKYADMLLQICTDYVNRHTYDHSPLAQAVNRALETLDKYSYYILGMGYMLYVEDIKYLREYISVIDSPENKTALDELNTYLATLEK